MEATMKVIFFLNHCISFVGSTFKNIFSAVRLMSWGHNYIHWELYKIWGFAWWKSVSSRFAVTPCVISTREVPMVLPEPYFSLSNSWDTSCAIRFFSEPVPQLRDTWDNTWCYRKPRRYNNYVTILLCKICHGAWTKSNYLIHIGEVPRPYGDQGKERQKVSIGEF